MIHGSSRRRGDGVTRQRKKEEKKSRRGIFFSASPATIIIWEYCITAALGDSNHLNLDSIPGCNVRRTPAPAPREDRSQGTGLGMTKSKNLRPPGLREQTLPKPQSHICFLR